MFKNIGFLVVIAMIAGTICGIGFPEFSLKFKLLNDIFIRLVGMVVAPIIFCTLVTGVIKHNSIKKLGKVAITAVVYFEIITTFALLIGLWASHIVKPGLHISLKHADAVQMVSSHLRLSNFILHIFPSSFADAFAQNNLIQILFFSIVFACACCQLKEHIKSMMYLIEETKLIFFQILKYIILFSPFASFGSMAYAVGKHGYHIWINFGKLIGVVYFSSALFIVIVLGLVSRIARFSLIGLLKHLKTEILLTFSTASSEAVLPQLIEKLNQYGCRSEITGLVVPLGYSLNLDGTSLYLSVAVIFIAQAFGIDLSLIDQIYIMIILMINAKGAAAVSGGGFIVLAATLHATHILPIEGLGLLISVDRILSPARAVTNVIGNSIATMFLSSFFDVSTSEE